MAANKKLTPAERALQHKWSRLKEVQNRQCLPGPTKKKAKGSSQPLQNTFTRNLQGVPGGGLVGMIAAKKTGTKVRSESIGLLRSARNANTTQGNYITTVTEDESGRVVSDPQGRRVFGR